MTKPRRSPNRAIIAAAAAGALLVGGAVIALAAQPDAPVITGPQFTNNPSQVFGIADADGVVNVNGAGTFLYDFDAGGTPATPLAAPGNVGPASPLAQGAHNLQAREVGGADPDGPVGTFSFVVDLTPPTIERDLPSTPTSGLYNTASVTVTHACGDTGGSGVLACLPSASFTSEGGHALPVGPIADKAGNSASLPAQSIIIDRTDPDVAALTGPLQVTNALTPTFTWSREDDITPTGVTQISGFKHYVVRIRQGASGTTVLHTATVSQPAPETTEVSYAGFPALSDGATYNWTVQSVDNAGNTVTSAPQAFKVDTSALADPSVSAGPVNGAATNDNTPTFSFTGEPGATFDWKLQNSVEADIAQPGYSGLGNTGTVTIPTLADGIYFILVRQNLPSRTSSGFAKTTFTVDTTAPAAPTINSSPGTTTNAQPSFGWSAAEQDGTFVWEVTGVGGIRVQGPGEAATAAVSLPSPLGAGNYAFRVRQRDRAGNLSDWSAGEPFTIVNPVDPGPGPGPGGGTSGFRPSTRNAKALLPRVGVKVKPAATTLRWKKTRGATLYNLQVFRIDGTTYRKVHSAFPRGLKYKVPKKVLKSGRRYVWRVWPYLGKKKKYTPAPFGISWFDAK